jgi:hypothetical protein
VVVVLKVILVVLLGTVLQVVQVQVLGEMELLALVIHLLYHHHKVTTVVLVQEQLDLHNSVAVVAQVQLVEFQVVQIKVALVEMVLLHQLLEQALHTQVEVLLTAIKPHLLRLVEQVVAEMVDTLLVVVI